MTESQDAGQRLGRVLWASNSSFGIGCRTLEANLPAFGTLVRAPCSDGGQVFGLIYDVRVEDDPFVRQLIAAGDLTDEVVEDQRRRRQVPVEVSVLVVGGRERGGPIYHRLPPQPPATLTWVQVCSQAELQEFGRELGFIRTVLNAAEVPSEELLAAALRHVAAVEDSPTAAQDYLVRAGRELARLLGRDPVRLDGVLQRMRANA